MDNIFMNLFYNLYIHIFYIKANYRKLSQIWHYDERGLSSRFISKGKAFKIHLHQTVWRQRINNFSGLVHTRQNTLCGLAVDAGGWRGEEPGDLGGAAGEPASEPLGVRHVGGQGQAP